MDQSSEILTNLTTPFQNSANNHISRFYVDDFKEISTRLDLSDYLKRTLMEKWQNQDENGNQNEYSRNGGIVHITEMQAWWLINFFCVYSALNSQNRTSWLYSLRQPVTQNRYNVKLSMLFVESYVVTITFDT